MTGQAIQPFRFLNATISHHHGDHLADCKNLFIYYPEYLRTVQGDREYTNDVIATNSSDSLSNVLYLMQKSNEGYGAMVTRPDYGGLQITEMSLPLSFVRIIDGDANARVNNASIITRIDAYGNSILLCGDMQKEAWKTIIQDNILCGPLWRPFLSNIDILVAPHHGHKSGYSIDLLNIARPTTVLISVQSKNPNVDSRYSQPGYISTRQKGHIKVTIEKNNTLLGKGVQNWFFGANALC